MSSASIIAFAHDKVGADILDYLLRDFSSDVKYVVIIPSDKKNRPVVGTLKRHGFNSKSIIEYSKELFYELEVLNQKEPIDYFLLLWWPKIITDKIIKIPRKAVINTHPGYLPYCRGKDPNFWSIVEDVPFGVSIHEVTPGIDDGPVICQKEIQKSWIDNGKTLYEKGLQEIVKLFIAYYPAIRTGNYQTRPQVLQNGSIHYRKELDPASEIKLDQNFTGREILNLLRARTFPPFQGCWFVENGEKYEIKLEIRKIDKG